MSKLNIGVTEQELKGVRRSKAGRAILDAAKNIADQNKFEVGDVLVARYKRDGRYITLASSNVPQKFVVIHKDEANIIYCKKINASGKLGVGVELPCTYSGDTFEFEVDPGQIDGVILDQEDKYDPFAEAKALRRHRDRVKRYNDSIKEDMGDRNTYHGVVAFMKKLKDRYSQESQLVFWTMNGNSDLNPEKHTVVSIEEVPVDRTIRKSQYTWQHNNNQAVDHAYIQAGLQTKFILKTKYTSNRHSSTKEFDMDGFWYRNVFLSQPKTNNMDEK